MPGLNLIESCGNCICGWENFKLLTEDELQMLNENRYEATFKAGEIMLKQGSPSSNVLFMANGMAKIYIECSNGKNFVMGISLPGMLILGPGAYVDLRHSYSVSALTAVNACFISFDLLRHLVKVNGAFAESFMEDISQKTLKSHNKLVSLTQKRMPGRLADALLYFADEVFCSDKYEMILSRQELGEMTNMAKECVVRMLKDMEDSGIIYSDSTKVEILNKGKLIQISEKG